MTGRIQKIISAHGIMSRRRAEQVISDGRVTVNGIKASLGDSANDELDDIRIDGKPIRKCDNFTYIALNKPKGYVTTMSDEFGRCTVSSLVSGVGVRLYPVGRLDMDSEGLLIMTNDGSFANKMMHPSATVKKVYMVTVEGCNIKMSAKELELPMDIDGYTIKPADVEIISVDGTYGELSITIHEGRNRQIRKMCEKCRLKVRKLVRIQEGNISLGSLPSGSWRYLSDNEIKSILESDKH